MSGSPCFACRTETKERKLRHLTKWAGAAVRMGQQGGQTEALWTHLDPSKPQERLHAPAGAHLTERCRASHRHALWPAAMHAPKKRSEYSGLKPISLEKKRTRVCVCKPVHGPGYCTRWLIKGYMLVGRKATICRSLNLLVAGAHNTHDPCLLYTRAELCIAVQIELLCGFF